MHYIIATVARKFTNIAKHSTVQYWCYCTKLNGLLRICTYDVSAKEYFLFFYTEQTILNCPDRKLHITLTKHHSNYLHQNYMEIKYI